MLCIAGRSPRAWHCRPGLWHDSGLRLGEICLAQGLRSWMWIWSSFLFFVFLLSFIWFTSLLFQSMRFAFWFYALNRHLMVTFQGQRRLLRVNWPFLWGFPAQYISTSFVCTVTTGDSLPLLIGNWYQDQFKISLFLHRIGLEVVCWNFLFHQAVFWRVRGSLGSDWFWCDWNLK